MVHATCLRSRLTATYSTGSGHHGARCPTRSIALVEHCQSARPTARTQTSELLHEIAQSANEYAAAAQERLDEALPVLRSDVAQYVLARQAWSDTFALYCLVRRERTLATLRPFALALAQSYAAVASR